MNRSQVWASAFVAKRSGGRFSPESCAEFADQALAEFDARFRNTPDAEIRGGGSDRQDSTTPVRSGQSSLIEEHITRFFDGYIRCPAATRWERAYLCAMLDFVLETGLPRHPQHDELRGQCRAPDVEPATTIERVKDDLNHERISLDTIIEGYIASIS